MTTYAANKRRLALLEPTTKRLPMNWRPVVEDICAKHRVCVGDVMSGWRGRNVVKARHAIWHAIRSRGAAMHHIGLRFGFHHTSVSYGIDLHAKRLAGTAQQQY